MKDELEHQDTKVHTSGLSGVEKPSPQKTPELEPITPPSDYMAAMIQNAELRAERRFLEQRLKDAEAKANENQAKGLGSIDEQMEVFLLKRDHTDLKAKHEASLARSEELKKKCDQLEEDQRGWNKIKEIKDGVMESLPEISDIVSGLKEIRSGQVGPQALPGSSGMDATSQALAGLNQDENLPERLQNLNPQDWGRIIQTADYMTANFNTEAQWSNLIAILDQLKGRPALIAHTKDFVVETANRSSKTTPPPAQSGGGFSFSSED